MNIKKIIIIIVIALFVASCFYNLVINRGFLFRSSEKIFNYSVSKSYYDSYSGVVSDKFIDSINHARPTIVLDSFGLKKRLDYVYQREALFQFIKLGDSIIKRQNSNTILLKRESLDTIIQLKFDNFINWEVYSKNNEMLGN